MAIGVLLCLPLALQPFLAGAAAASGAAAAGSCRGPGVCAGPPPEPRKSGEFFALLQRHPLVASVQASPGSPLADAATLAALAEASVRQGVRILRAEGSAAIRAIHEATGASLICIVKRDYPGSEVRITATALEVEELLELPCDVIAMDATARARPGLQELGALVARAHAGGLLVMGDCDDLASMELAVAAGVDMVGSTLAGYTGAPSTQRRGLEGPALELVREAAARLGVPVIAEGRLSSPSHVFSAMRAGAAGVTIGGAINDPVKTTQMLLRGAHAGILSFNESSRIGAFDIGGTWLRYGLFSADWRLLRKERLPLPKTAAERRTWMLEQVSVDGVSCVGVSTGGVVHPLTGVVTSAKEEVIPDHVGFDFKELFAPLPVVALNDGLATAWAHACLPEFAGLRVATLALGTGVGCGFVNEHMQLLMGTGGAPPSLNDLLAPVASPDGGVGTFEQALGGLHLGRSTDRDGALLRARSAASAALSTVSALWLPDAVVMAGGVGLGAGLVDTGGTHAVSDSGSGTTSVRVVPSPLGPDAGLHAAAALALFDPRRLL